MVTPSRSIKPAWSHLRLEDRIQPGVKVLFVGINPGVRSALTGHHFAGYSNRFWKLLWDARLVRERISYADDDRLPEWGFGITNLIARPSPGIDDLRPHEYIAGWHVLEKKIDRFKPRIVALIGVTLYRAMLPMLHMLHELHGGDDPRPRKTGGSVLGRRPETIHGAQVFVLPNPSGRNANFTYAEMLAAYRALTRALKGSRGSRGVRGAKGSRF